MTASSLSKMRSSRRESSPLVVREVFEDVHMAYSASSM